MGLRYNPFNGSFDFTRSPASYMDGEVATFADLPLSATAAPLNSAWLVRQASGVYFLARKPAGIYIRTATGGTDRNADYTYASAFPDVFSDANFTVYDDADATRSMQIQVADNQTLTFKVTGSDSIVRSVAFPLSAILIAALMFASSALAQNIGIVTGTNGTVITGRTNTLTFSNKAVFPAQTADSGASLMTRDLSDDRSYFLFGLVDWARPNLGSTANANGATGSVNAAGFDLTTSTNTNSVGLWNASSGGGFGRKQTTMGGNANVVWSGKIVANWYFLRLGSQISELRAQYGRQFNATNHAALGDRGVGIRINGASVFFETHNGSSGFETTNSQTTYAGGPVLFSVVVEGGSAKFYKDNVLISTITNNVATNSVADNAFGYVLSVSNTASASSTLRVAPSPGFIIQQ